MIAHSANCKAPKELVARTQKLMTEHVPAFKNGGASIYFDCEGATLSNEGDIMSAPLTDGSKAFMFYIGFPDQAGLDAHIKALHAHKTYMDMMGLVKDGLSAELTSPAVETIHLINRLPKDYRGYFCASWKATFPKEHMPEILKFYKHHNEWINNTHTKAPFVGDKALFYYNVSTGPVFKDALDPTKGVYDDKVHLVMTEIYKTNAALKDHFELAMKDGILEQLGAAFKGAAVHCFAGEVKNLF
jgi:hypothetical protein